MVLRGSCSCCVGVPACGIVSGRKNHLRSAGGEQRTAAFKENILGKRAVFCVPYHVVQFYRHQFFIETFALPRHVVDDV